jgi:hypothetical protein
LDPPYRDPVRLTSQEYIGYLNLCTVPRRQIFADAKQPEFLACLSAFGCAAMRKALPKAALAMHIDVVIKKDSRMRRFWRSLL